MIGRILFEDGRPWGEADLLVALWKLAPWQTVRLDELVLTQDKLNAETLFAAVRGKTPGGGDPLPHLVRWKGRLFVSDGHHRIALAIIRGAETIDARILEIGP